MNIFCIIVGGVLLSTSLLFLLALTRCEYQEAKARARKEGRRNGR